MTDQVTYHLGEPLTLNNAGFTARLTKQSVKR